MLGVFISMGSVLAQDGRVGAPQDKKINFQEPATDVMESIINLHGTIFLIITVITLLVLGLMIWIVVRYNRKTNPTPSKTTHHTMLEVVWTIIPVIILVYIGKEGIELLYEQDVIPEADMVITATGNQWYWSYEYPEEGLSFEANMVPSDYSRGLSTGDEKADWDQRMEELRILLGRTEPIVTRRLLDTDTRVVVPVDTTVKVLVTASDVLHAWTIPAFGFKLDAVPGKVQETWFKAREVGTFYGQCSELCGIKHAFMPIVVEVMSKEDYALWLARAKGFYANGTLPEENTRVVENAADEAAGQ